MKTTRRNFIHTASTGAAGMGLACSIPSFVTQVNQETKNESTCRKLIIRADDVGYTEVCNIGAFEAIEKGVVTSADVMLDTPGTEDALERLKTLPWISVGWHKHFWGSPVLKLDQVPSLVINENGRPRFRKDLTTAKDVIFEEALAELHTQMERCVRILGKAPDTGGSEQPGDSPFSKAIAQVCKEYGIANASMGKGNIVMANQGTDYQTQISTDSIGELDKIDPAKHLIESPWDYKENDYVVSVYHPGYVDYYVYRLGDYGPYAKNFILVRLLDVEALCSERLKNWIKENFIELCNYRDAMYGTREYHNHLKSIGSDLAVD